MTRTPRETGEPDDELLEWRAGWQADPEPAPEVRDLIRRRVKRRSLKMALSTAGELVTGIAMLVFVAWSALRDPTAINVGAMACLALLILWAMSFSLWYLRGTWRPRAETTSAFVALSVLRCQRRLQALRAGWWLLALELAVMIPWICLRLKAQAAAWSLLAFLTALVSVCLIAAQRRTRRELREWEEMRASLG